VPPAAAKPPKAAARALPAEQAAGKRKLSFKEARELADMPAMIEGLELEQKEVHDLFADIDFHKIGPARIAQAKARARFLADEIAKAYERWKYLEENF